MRFDQYLAHTYPVISLCQYDARRFSGVGLLGALKTHRDTFDFPLPRFLAN
jgi:transcriptional repressor of dcmA and dcmR